MRSAPGANLNAGRPLSIGPGTYFSDAEIFHVALCCACGLPYALFIFVLLALRFVYATAAYMKTICCCDGHGMGRVLAEAIRDNFSFS